MRRSLFFSDVKQENTPSVALAISEYLDIPLYVINPDGGFEDQGCVGVNVNVFEPTVESYWSDAPEIYQLSTQFADEISAICSPKSAGENAEFFDLNGQAFTNVTLSFLTVNQPETATPARLGQILSNAEEALDILNQAAHFKSPVGHDPFVEDMRAKSKTLLKIVKDTPKFLPQFLDRPQKSLACFDQTGALNALGEFATIRLSDIRTKHCVFALMTPLHRLQRYRTFISLTAYAIGAACKVHRGKDAYPVHMCLDEFIALSWPGFDQDMNVLRGLGCSAEIYAQNRAGIVKAFGEKETEQILANCDSMQLTTLDTYEDAEYASKLLGTRRVKSQTSNIGGAGLDEVNFSIGETEIPIMSPTELMAMPADEQIIKIRGMRPIRARKIPWWEIGGLRELVGENPLEGPAPKVPAKVKLSISRDGVRLVAPQPKPPAVDAPRRKRDAPLIRLSSFLWVPAWMVVGTLVEFYWGWSIWPF